MYVRARTVCKLAQNCTLVHVHVVASGPISGGCARQHGGCQGGPFTKGYLQNSAIQGQFMTKPAAFFKQLALGTDIFWP